MKSHPHPDNDNRDEAALNRVDGKWVAVSKPQALGMVESRDLRLVKHLFCMNDRLLYVSIMELFVITFELKQSVWVKMKGHKDEMLD